MSHLKKDFKYHKLFDNKYAQQSYIAYLSKGKRKYVMNSGDFVDRYIVVAIDFIFRLNNAISRRGVEKNNIADIKKLYEKDINEWIYFYYGSIPIRKIFDKIDTKDINNDYKQEIYDMLKTIVDWEDKFEDNYKEFKEVIYNLVKTIDDKHYDWVVGENIIYNRSVRDNISKSFYCVVIGDNGYKKFKNSYLEKVYIEPKDKNKLLEQISDILIIIADTYNELVYKHFDSASEILNDYIQENKIMLNCKDIYYAKLYVELSKTIELLNNNKHTEAIKHISSIIQNENLKYKKDLIMFEKIAIDEKAIESGQYIEL